MERNAVPYNDENSDDEYFVPDEENSDEEFPKLGTKEYEMAVKIGSIESIARESYNNCIDLADATWEKDEKKWEAARRKCKKLLTKTLKKLKFAQTKFAESRARRTNGRGGRRRRTHKRSRKVRR